MRKHLTRATCFALASSLVILSPMVGAHADSSQDNGSACQGLPSHAALKAALTAAQGEPNGGFGLEMWATVVNRDGIVCAVAFTGDHRGDQWPGSRVISAQKANTANAFSLPRLALSTANLYSATQPGGSLFGLQKSRPVDVSVAYGGNASDYGRANDPMAGGKIGGINVFGGGLALYASNGQLVGGLGVSGDSSCADHNIAWRVRAALSYDTVPGGVSGDASRPDNIVYDITPQAGQMPGVSPSGWGHPVCTTAAMTLAAGLPGVAGSDPVVPPPTVIRGGYGLNRATGQFVQQVTLRNDNATPITGSIYLVLDALTNASLANATGTTTNRPPLGSPYIAVLAPGATLPPGASVNVVLQFNNPTRAQIAYDPRVLVLKPTLTP